ncbi:MAG: hypothetical protein ACREF4_21635 [Gammaproteobacteria bacterium]
MSEPLAPGLRSTTPRVDSTTADPQALAPLAARDPSAEDGELTEADLARVVGGLDWSQMLLP